jgi:hypothetical protein
MLVATADKLRLYRCSSPRERYDANFCNLVLGRRAAAEMDDGKQMGAIFLL